MKILIVGGDTRLLNHIENQICQCHNEAIVFKATALNKAVLRTQMTAFDIVISTLQMSCEESSSLSCVFRSENYNAHTPFVSICEQEQETVWLDSFIHKTIEPNYFASSIDELLQITNEILIPDELAQVA